MAVAPSVARARFGRFVERALRDARDRGMTDKDIHAATGIGPSTFHRWQSTEGGLPKLDRVMAFCVGLEIPPEAALNALGITGERPTATPESPLDPDLKRLARILTDPNVPEAEKQAIRHTIRMLARASRIESEPEPAS
jgi:transcriptional regulator with XRE-family HTH domain